MRAIVDIPFKSCLQTQLKYAYGSSSFLSFNACILYWVHQTFSSFYYPISLFVWLKPKPALLHIYHPEVTYYPKLLLKINKISFLVVIVGSAFEHIGHAYCIIDVNTLGMILLIIVFGSLIFGIILASVLCDADAFLLTNWTCALEYCAKYLMALLDSILDAPTVTYGQDGLLLTTFASTSTVTLVIGST